MHKSTLGQGLTVSAAGMALSANEIADLNNLSQRTGVQGARYNDKQMGYINR